MILREDASRSPVDKNWVYRFLKRIPPLHNLHFIKQKPKEKKRMEAEDISYLTAWYKRLNQYVESNQLRPRDIYNFDETGFQIGQGKPQKVVSKSQTLYSPNGGIAEGITGIECIAADGWKMVPWFLVRGKFHMENWYKDTNLPTDYTLVTTPNGYTTDQTAIQWLKAFDLATKDRTTRGSKRLLLMDNHGSHRTPEFIAFAAEKGIIPYCFIPHTTHLCQPLDSKPFLALKHCYQSNNNAVVQWGGSVDRKTDFFREIVAVRDTLTTRVIKSGFVYCGISPFNYAMVLNPLKKEVDYGNDLVIFGEDEDDGSEVDFPSSTTNSPPRDISRINESTRKLEADIELLDSELYTAIRHRAKLLCRSARISAELATQLAKDNTTLLRHKVHRDTR
ncbi:hypothetical protein VN97_g13276, partial [Penicillium thymicola]